MSRHLKRVLLIACLVACTSGHAFAQSDSAVPQKDDSTAQVAQKSQQGEVQKQKTFKDYKQLFSKEMRAYMGRYRRAPTKAAKQQEYTNRPMIKPLQPELTELLKSSSISDETQEGVQWWYRKAKVENHHDVVLRLIVENFPEAEFIEEHIHKLPYDLPHSEIEKYLRSILHVNTYDTARARAIYQLRGVLNKNVKELKGEKAKMVKTELKSLKDTLLSKYADIENVNGIKLTELVEAQEFESKLEIGKPVPDIVGQDLNGVEFKLSDYHGKVTMISYWAFW